MYQQLLGRSCLMKVFMEIKTLKKKKKNCIRTFSLNLTYISDLIGKFFVPYDFFGFSTGLVQL